MVTVSLPAGAGSSENTIASITASNVTFSEPVSFLISRLNLLPSIRKASVDTGSGIRIGLGVLVGLGVGVLVGTDVGLLIGLGVLVGLGADVGLLIGVGVLIGTGVSVRVTAAFSIPPPIFCPGFVFPDRSLHPRIPPAKSITVTRQPTTTGAFRDFPLCC